MSSGRPDSLTGPKRSDTGARQGSVNDKPNLGQGRLALQFVKGWAVKIRATQHSGGLQRSRRPRTSVVLLATFFCCCSGLSDKIDWDRLKPKVVRYGDAEAELVKAHLNRFKECKHRDIAEDFFFTRCSGELSPARKSSACRDYLEMFPSGSRISDVRFELLGACRRTDEKDHEASCKLYLAMFPNGDGVEAAQAVLATEPQRREEEARQRDAQRKAAEERAAALDRVWSGTLVDVLLDLPPGLNLAPLTLEVAERDLRPDPVHAPRISVPIGYPLKICYGTVCVADLPVRALVRVPLTRVYLSYPPGIAANCFTCYDKYPVEETYVMPGSHRITFKFYDSSRYPDGSELVRSGEANLDFDAPKLGGTVHAGCTVDGGQLRTAAATSEAWEARRVPWLLRP